MSTSITTKTLDRVLAEGVNSGRIRAECEMCGEVLTPLQHTHKFCLCGGGADPVYHYVPQGDDLH